MSRRLPAVGEAVTWAKRPSGPRNGVVRRIIRYDDAPRHIAEVVFDDNRVINLLPRSLTYG